MSVLKDILYWLCNWRWCRLKNPGHIMSVMQPT